MGSGSGEEINSWDIWIGNGVRESYWDGNEAREELVEIYWRLVEIKEKKEEEGRRWEKPE